MITGIDKVRKPLVEKFENHTLWGLDRSVVQDIAIRFDSEFNRFRLIGFDKVLNYHRDNRTDEEYLYDILYGWSIEELYIARLELYVKTLDPGARVLRNGTDWDRRIKFRLKDIRSLQDIEIFWSNGSRKKIEIQSTRQGRRDGKGYDHKDNKIELAIKDNSIFLWINPIEGEVFIVTVSDIQKRGVPSTAYGGKKTHKIYDIPDCDYIKITDPMPYRYQQLLGFTKSVLRKATERELGDKYGRVSFNIKVSEATRAWLRGLVLWEKASKKPNDYVCGPIDRK